MARLGPSAFPALLVVLTAAAASAQSYWAVEDGAVLDYEDGGRITVERYGDRVAHVQSMICVSRHYYRLGADGDVMFERIVGSCGGFGEAYDYDPPLLLLDLPLDTGKTWDAVSTWYGADHRVYDTCVHGEVRGPATTALPGIDGDVPVIAVHLSFLYIGILGPPPPNEEMDWLLHAQLGRVERLLAWQGVVPDEPTAWGGVKALYR